MIKRYFKIRGKEYSNKKASTLMSDGIPVQYIKGIFTNIDFSYLNLVDLDVKFEKCQFINCKFYKSICTKYQFIDCKFDKDCSYIFNNGKEKGQELIGYKLLKTDNDMFKDKYIIAKVIVPCTADRMCGNDDICKSKELIVTDFYTLKGERIKWSPFRRRRYVSICDAEQVYTKGKLVKSKFFYAPATNTVTGDGLYFFNSQSDVINYAMNHLLIDFRGKTKCILFNELEVIL